MNGDLEIRYLASIEARCSIFSRAKIPTIEMMDAHDVEIKDTRYLDKKKCHKSRILSILIEGDPRHKQNCKYCLGMLTKIFFDMKMMIFFI